MEANNFVSKLKANGNSEDIIDLTGAFAEYQTISTNLSTKERSLFALNVFCTLCRNQEKVPSWSEKIDYQYLLEICVQCVRDSKSLTGEQRLKVLGCIYHLQKCLVHAKTKIHPEIVMKASFLAFEDKTIIENYGKTYWNIIVDRLSYIEKLKNNKINIIKLLDSVIQDGIRIIQIYDTYEFISNCLQFFIKKLYFLYSDFHSPRLSKAYEMLFQAFSPKKNCEKIKNLNEKELVDLYVKVNNCIIVLTENDNKLSFKNTILNSVVKSCISLLGSYDSVFHMYQTCHQNFLCRLLTEKCDSKSIETIFSNISKTFDSSEKMGYKNIFDITVPFLYQVIKLFIEFVIGNASKIEWSLTFDTGAQLKCMQFVGVLMPKLSNGTQIVKCENCTVKSGCHDALRLSFLTKNFITTSINKKLDLKDILPEYYNMLMYQLKTIDKLGKLKCINSEKCYKKIQTDIHNTAILLNKQSYYEYSIKFFDLYLKNELKTDASELDYKNISRAFYNKAICELDYKLYKTSLISAGLSQMFAIKDETNDKQMGLIIDVKAKQLNIQNDVVPDLQNISLLDIYKMAIKENSHGDLTRFFGDLKFSTLLHHEFSAYARLWPSIQPVVGVWRSMSELAEGKHPELLTFENENDILWTLYEIILKTTSAVKSIHNEVFEEIIGKIIKNFEVNPPTTLELRIIFSTMRIIQGEYDLKKASEIHEWKIDANTNPDKTSYNRSVSDEHNALRNILEAVTLWTDLGPALIKTKNFTKGPYLADVLNVMEIGALELLNCCKLLEGLQLTHIGCVLAENWGYKLHYIRNTSLILYYARSENTQLNYMLKLCVEYTSEYGNSMDNINWVLIYVCNCAMYSYRYSSYRLSAQLVQYVQSRILDLQRKKEYENVNLDMSIGHLLEVQTMLCGDVESPTLLSSLVTAQRHFLNITNTASSYQQTRYSRLLRLVHISHLSVLAVSISAQLQLWRRASATAGCVPLLSAVQWVRAQSAACNTSFGDEVVVTIESLLRNVLNIDSSTLSENRAKPEKSNVKKPPPKITVNSKQFIIKTDDCDLISNETEFKMADFFKHDSSCRCYVCDTPFIYICTSKLYNLRAGTHFKQKQHELARNYFDGALATIGLVENKLETYRKNYLKLYEPFLLDIVDKIYKDEFYNCEVELLIDAAFNELSNNNVIAVDDHVVRIHEIKQHFAFSKYLNSEVYNLLFASAKIKNSVIKTDTDMQQLEKEMGSIHLSPNNMVKVMKTPENKPSKPPKSIFNKVDDEELPKVIPRPIKIDLESDFGYFKPTEVTNPEFKVPLPNTIKPSLESITPLKTPRTVDVFKTPMTKLNTNKDLELETPKSESPEQFFTPMTSIKSYSNRKNKNCVAVNLNDGFSQQTGLTGDESDKKNSKDVKRQTVSVKKNLGDKGSSNVQNKSKVVEKKSTVIERKSTIGVKKSTATEKSSRDVEKMPVDVKRNEDKENLKLISRPQKTGARPKERTLSKTTVDKGKSSNTSESLENDGKRGRIKSQRDPSPVKSEIRPIRRLKPPHKY